jgi:hypothetical protein
MTGLRGCYMPDDSYSVAVSTRRALKAILRDESDRMTDNDMTREECRAASQLYRHSDRDIASVAAALWRRRPTDRDSYLSTVLPYGTNDAFGIQVNPITRDEYLEAQEQNL